MDRVRLGMPIQTKRLTMLSNALPHPGPLRHRRGRFYDTISGMELSQKRINIVIAVILFMAAFFVFFQLDRGDVITDEGAIAFRGLGYMDYLATPFQRTPYESLCSPSPKGVPPGCLNPPGWLKLSFHDHPPLLFGIERILFSLIGDSLFVLRLPHAIFGLASIFILYLIGSSLHSQKMGLLAASIAALNSYMIWTARIGLQEAAAIFFILLSLYLLIKACAKPKLFLAWGIAFGLGLLTKFTVLIVLPISLFYILFAGRKLYKEKFLYFGLLIAFIFFLPVIIYNYNLYQISGHFDLQFSAIFNQDTPEWQTRGQIVGSLAERINIFFPNLWKLYSPIFFMASIGAYLYVGWQLIYKKVFEQNNQIELWPFVATNFMILFVIYIAPTVRFLAMLVPFFILLIAYGAVQLLKIERVRKISIVILIAFILYEGYFMLQTNHVNEPIESPWVYSIIKYENYPYGYNALEVEVKKLLDNEKPAVTLELPKHLTFIKQFRDKDVRKISGNPESAKLIVYDSQINAVAANWIFERRYYYDGWPIIPSLDYVTLKEKNQLDTLRNLGITDFYYIASTEATYTIDNGNPPATVAEFNNEVKNSGIEPETIISNFKGEAVFEIYHFTDLF